MPLPDDSLEKWLYKEHTKIKHEILCKYLSGWIKILGKSHRRVCYFDCFAGKGEYEDGSKGSPLVAIETASRLKEKFPYLKEIRCIFIEKNENNFENLRRVIYNEIKQQPEKYEGIKITTIHNEFANVAKEIVDKYNETLAPSFFFIDPFGFSGVPFDIIKNILSIKRTEVFINFMVRDVNRFLNSSKHRTSIEELYGLESVQEAINSTYPSLSREESLLRLYRDRLHEDANVKYIFPFKVYADEVLQTTYYLIHATNHPLGCKLMKEIMYRSGTEGRFGYLGPAEGQLTLHSFNISDIKDFLLKCFAGRCLCFREIINGTLMDTCLIEKHYRTALRDLEKEGNISITGKGPKGGLNLDAKITFP